MRRNGYHSPLPLNVWQRIEGPRASRLGIHVLISGGPHIACDIIFYAHFSVGAHMRALAESAALCGAQFARGKFPERKGQCGETEGMGGVGITGI